MGTRIDGKKVAARTKADLAKRVELLKARGIQPGLGTILVGSDPGSVKYVAGKHADCAEIGVISIKRELPEKATSDRVADAVRQLKADPACTGYIVQLPLPRESTRTPSSIFDPKKDADGMHPYNLGELVLHARGDITTVAMHASRRDRAVARLRHRFGRQGGVRAGPWHHHRPHHRSVVDS